MVVDTNGDLTPDTLLPGTSNFLPGWSPITAGLTIGGRCQTCHAADGEMNCYFPSGSFPSPHRQQPPSPVVEG